MVTAVGAEIPVVVKMTDCPGSPAPVLGLESLPVTAIVVPHGASEMLFKVRAVTIGLTVWLMGVAVLGLKLPSPPYVASMVREPTDSVDVLMLAEPLTKATGEPKFVPSILNWTVPDRIPAPGAIGVIAAVKVTDWPKTDDGVTDELSTVAVSALFTFCVSMPGLLAKLVSPLYIADIVCDPTDIEDVPIEVALPAVKATGEPKLEPSILNWTVPVGVPAPDVTVPVNVSASPLTDGL